LPAIQQPLASDVALSDIALQEELDPAVFFGRGLSPDSSYNSLLLSTATPDQLQHFDLSVSEFLTYLVHASVLEANQESAIDELARSTLRVTGFAQPGKTILRTRLATPLLICGDSGRSAKSDVAVLHTANMILLLVQTDKTLANVGNDPEPQLIAEDIAAFQYNNRTRRFNRLPELDSMTIPCMTIVGTQPHFYLVTVTNNLSMAVAVGNYPEATTVVKWCRPPHLPFPRRTVGLEDVEYRRVALQYYVTFLKWAEECWEEML
jgi:hypothetical protein